MRTGATDGARMYSKIMVPVDLAHAETLGKAIATAADLSRHYDAPITLLGVTAPGPTRVADTPEQYAARLARYAVVQTDRHSVMMEPRAVTDPDPIAALHSVLRDQIAAVGADLVIMASHVPSWRDYLLSSNAGYLAAHANVSLFIVR